MHTHTLSLSPTKVDSYIKTLKNLPKIQTLASCSLKKMN